MTREAKIRAFAALTIAVTLWASSFVVLKFAFRQFDPMVVIFGRMLVAAICLLFIKKRIPPVNYRPGDWKLLLFMGVCEPGLYFVFEALALSYTDASQAGMICAMLPVIVAVAARMTLGEHISRKTMYGFGLAVIGAVTLSAAAAPTSTASNPILGNFLEFLAMICAAGYMVTMKGLSDRYNSWFLTLVQALIGTLFYFPLLFIPTTTIPTAFPLMGLLAIVYLGFAVTVGGYGLYNYGLSKIPASQASAFINLIPVITLVLGVTLLNEKLNTLQYIASAAVVIGVYISQEKFPEQAPIKDPA